MAYITASDRPIQSVSFVEDLDFDALHININIESESAKYPAKKHARQVSEILRIDSARKGLIYLTGRPSHIYWEDSDQPPPFRQRRYFYYLSGVDFEDCHVIYNMHEDQLILFIPKNDPYKVVWNGATPSLDECRKKYDADRVFYDDMLAPYITQYMKFYKKDPIYVLHSNQQPLQFPESSADSVKTKNLKIFCMEGLKPVLESTLLQPAMDASRVIKSDHEINLIRRANEISGEAHTNVLRGIKKFSNESEVEAAFGATCVAANAKTQAYGIIAASGVNASTLHYIANDEPLAGRQLLCIDAGCEWKCYASDVTRTFPVSGKFSKEGQEIYDVVEEMQEECIRRIKKGTQFHDLHVLAHDIALRGLMKLGILRNGSEDEIRESGATVAFFPHGLGHHLGLEVHDVSGPNRLLLPTILELHKTPQRGLKDVSNTVIPNTRTVSLPYNGRQKLLPNMVVTVEPGIYFSRYALENVYLKSPKIAKYINAPLLETYYPVGGVRIEDDILVTEEGYENLTTAPKGDEALKIINESSKKGLFGF